MAKYEGPVREGDEVIFRGRVRGFAYIHGDETSCSLASVEHTLPDGQTGAVAVPPEWLELAPEAGTSS